MYLSPLIIRLHAMIAIKYRKVDIRCENSRKAHPRSTTGIFTRFEVRRTFTAAMHHVVYRPRFQKQRIIEAAVNRRMVNSNSPWCSRSCVQRMPRVTWTLSYAAFSSARRWHATEIRRRVHEQACVHSRDWWERNTRVALREKKRRTMTRRTMRSETDNELMKRRVATHQKHNRRRYVIAVTRQSLRQRTRLSSLRHVTPNATDVTLSIARNPSAQARREYWNARADMRHVTQHSASVWSAQIPHCRIYCPINPLID